jgi:HSP20 family molecular chaperone IbpA
MTKYSITHPEFLIVDKFFNDFFKDVQCVPNTGFPVYDMWSEVDGTLVQEWALAGYSLNDLSIQVEGDKLVVACEKASKSGPENRRIAKRAFREVFTDYKGALDLTKIKASFVNGVLRVEIPPKQNKQQVKVEISSDR